MAALEPKLKKKKGDDFFKLDDDLDEDWVRQHQTFLVQEQRQKIEKKFQKENEKLVAEGEKEMKAKELQERLKVADELEAMFKKENDKKKFVPEGKNPSIERMEAALKKLDDRIEAMNTQAEVRESTKEVALGTSKIVSIAVCAVANYLADGLPELHRSPPDRGLFEEVQRADRTLLLEESARKIRLGNQVGR